jgi:hypothetical protein
MQESYIAAVAKIFGLATKRVSVTSVTPVTDTTRRSISSISIDTAVSAPLGDSTALLATISNVTDAGNFNSILAENIMIATNITVSVGVSAVEVVPKSSSGTCNP